MLGLGGTKKEPTISGSWVSDWRQEGIEGGVHIGKSVADLRGEVSEQSKPGFSKELKEPIGRPSCLWNSPAPRSS